MSQYSFEQITADEVKRRLDAGEPLTLVDIREPIEWAMGGVIPGAQLAPMRQFLLQGLDGLDKEQEVILVCASGIRTIDAAVYMGTKGFKNAKSMSGGMKAWKGSKVSPAT